MHAIHHVTAIGGDPHRTLDFYAGTLGLRLVKKTVNFDDPTAYHLYFGDAAGEPGTVMTFFSWPDAAPGQPGAGELSETAFRVPAASLDWWADRLSGHGAARSERFGDPVLTFRDGDGTRLALVGLPGLDAEPAWTGAVPAEAAPRGFGRVSLASADPEATAAILTDVFGFAAGPSENGTRRFQAGGDARGGTVDLQPAQAGPSRLGRGSVHHLAFRAPDDAAQAALADRLAKDHGIRPTGQKDRDYFRSVYFREPGGILFEIATDGPGFAVDEDPATLGSALRLPAFLAPRRPAIEAALPDLG